ncbi:hypothetical protein V2G26_016182 [Clonostachys chloroleuca]
MSRTGKLWGSSTGRQQAFGRAARQRNATVIAGIEAGASSGCGVRGGAHETPGVCGSPCLFLEWSSCNSGWQ